MYQKNSIINDEGNIELFALWDEINEKWFMTAIEFKEIEEREYPATSLCWDNDDFIFNKFYMFLWRWYTDDYTEEDEETFKEIWVFSKNEIKELIEMLDEALKQGWYDKTKGN